MKITKGKINSAQKVVIYGPEGIGKSTFASRFPEPLFIDTEGSTKFIDVARTEKPSSWIMLQEQIRYIIQHPDTCKTLVIDTIDWAEQLCVEDVCARHNKKGIEDFGFGNGYVYCKEEFGRFLNLLNDVIEKGINVALTAHTQIRKFEQPDEMGSYDRYELKLGKKTASQTAPLVKEWADMVLFANYKTFSIATDDKGKKHKAQGGTRIMYTMHHPCWDAKNRHGLPDEMPFDYVGIAHIFSVNETVKQVKVEVKQEPAAEHKTETAPDEIPFGDAPVLMPDATAQARAVNEKIPKQIRDLMIENKVDEYDIQSIVAKRGYYPEDTPIENYDPDFINGVLVGAWPKVYEMICQMKNEIPFN